jgi:sugar-specific transcriptional regulator TrmB
MKDIGNGIDKDIERAVRDILKSRARSRIYLYLLRKGGAQTAQIIKGTRLHPSTVRETLSIMHEQHLVIREKLKNESIGKNPYLYYPISPIILLQRYIADMEFKLNKLATLVSTQASERNNDPNTRREKVDIL